MRRAALLLTVTATLLAASPAGAQGASGGAQAPSSTAKAPATSASTKGGARYSTPPKRRARKRTRATSDHAFPVAGPYSLGGEDSRFGAARRGHTHQGQDISAPEGTPVVAPWAGTVEAVKYQAGGAGHYVVLDGDGEDRDYVFMHLRQGSVLVTKGAPVAKGQQLAEVGNTGSSSGAHLHFEIWIDGGWYTGGRPTDPLPFLQAWLR